MTNLNEIFNLINWKPFRIPLSFFTLFHFLIFLQTSNILFILGPPLLIYLFREYGKFVNSFIHVVWTLLILVGLSSAYFHATLSFAGQMLDELTILWVFFGTFAVFVPKRYLPKIFKNRKRFCIAMFFFTLLSTFFSFYK